MQDCLSKALIRVRAAYLELSFFLVNKLYSGGDEVFDLA